MARKTKTDPFDFSKAKNSIPFRTPMTGGVSRQVMKYADEWQKANAWGNVDSQGRIYSEASFATPFKVLAMMAARMVRLGIPNTDKLNAIATIAKNSPRGPIANRFGRSMIGAGIEEASTIKAFQPSTIFTRGFSASPEQVGMYYRAIAKVMGRASVGLDPATTAAARAAAGILKRESRKYWVK
jgi:hypothetical protein